MQNRIAISTEQPLSIASKRHIAVCHKLSQFLSVRLTKVFRAHLYAVSRQPNTEVFYKNKNLLFSRTFGVQNRNVGKSATPVHAFSLISL